MSPKRAEEPKPAMRLVPWGGGPGEEVELLVEGKVASWLSIIELEWRIGGAAIRMAGIGGVGTDAAHRNKGYSRLCMDRALERMRERGYLMTALFGIPDYYPKWGYASVMPEPRLKIATRFAEQSKPLPGLRIRPFDKKLHGRDVLKIYESNNRTRTGSLIRPGFQAWKPFRMGSWWGVPTEAFVLARRGGPVLGYASHDRKDQELIVVEAGVRSPEVYGALTSELARRAVVKRVSEIEVCAPQDHPFADYLRGWNTQHNNTFYKNSQGMARILDLTGCLGACAPDLSPRSRLLGPKSWSLTLATDIGTATLQGRGGKIQVRPGPGGKARARLPQSLLVQIMMGYRGVEEAAGEDKADLPAEARDILGALFPRAFPYMWAADRF